MRRIALIPSYEPDDALLKIVNELLEHDFNVVVVNDGSSTKYNEIFDKLPKEVHYLNYEVNQGKGYALKYGFNYIKQTFDKDTIVVTMDSDGQHTVKDALSVCEKCEEVGGLVLGSRHFDKSTPIKSRFGNWMARTTFLLFAHHKIYDTQTGLRAVTYDLIDDLILIKGNRYEYEINVLLEFVRNNILISEVPIETIYIDGNSGTHYSPFKDTMKIFAKIIKFSISSFIGFLVDIGMFALLSLFNGVGIANWLTIKNVSARIVSASVNFTINYRVVFKSKEHIILAILKYAVLAAMILLCGTKLLNLLVIESGINEFLAKIFVEVTMFLISYLVQNSFVFREKRK